METAQHSHLSHHLRQDGNSQQLCSPISAMETTQHSQLSHHLRQDEQSSYKNQLQQYAQRAGLDLPVYFIKHTTTPQAQQFKCSVIVEDDTYESPSTFPQKKAAEQDAAKCAMKDIFEKRLEKGSSILSTMTAICKAILHEFAAKIQVQIPKYNIVQTQVVPLPVFISTLEFRGLSYTGGPAKTKRDAEQLVAHDVIISVLGDSEVGLTLLEILKSKAKFLSSSQLSKDPSCCAIRLEEVSNSEGDGASGSQLVSASDVPTSTSNEEQLKDASNSSALQTQVSPDPPLIQNQATPQMQTVADESCKGTSALKADSSAFPVPSLSQNEGCKITYALQADSVPTNEVYKITPASQDHGSVIHVVPSSENQSCEIKVVPRVDSSVSVLPESPQNPTTPLQTVADQGLKVTSAPQAVVGLQSHYPPQEDVLPTEVVSPVQDGSASLSSQASKKRIRNKRYKANKRARMANQVEGQLCSAPTLQS